MKIALECQFYMELPNLADIVEIDEQKDIFETRYHENIEADNESH